MTREQFCRHLQSIAASEKVQLLARLGHNLTVVARGASGEADPSWAVRKLQALNELQHTLTGKLMAVGGDPDAFPDEDFLEVMFEKAQRDGCEPDLIQAIRWTAPAAV